MTRQTRTPSRAQAWSEVSPVCCCEPLESRDLLSAVPVLVFHPLVHTVTPAIHVAAKPAVITPSPIVPSVTGVSAVTGNTNLVAGASQPASPVGSRSLVTPPTAASTGIGSPQATGVTIQSVTGVLGGGFL